MENPLSTAFRSPALVGWAKRLGLPLVVFVLARLVLRAIATANGSDADTSPTWAHWDSGHYLKIATDGYEYYSCQGTGFGLTTQMCGNTGWMPAYSWLIRLLSWIGIAPVTAGVVISAAFHFGTLVLLWARAWQCERSWRAVGALTLAACFPGQVYQHAIFPLSMFCFFSVAALTEMIRGRFWLASLSGAAASLTYSTGFLLAPLLGFGVLLFGTQYQWRTRILRGLASASMVGAGFALVLLIDQIAVGAWDAFFRVQEKYGHSIHRPWTTLKHATAGILENRWDGGRGVIAAETLFVAALIVPAVLAAAWILHRRADRRGLLVGAFTLVFWLFPLMMGDAVSLYRAEAALLPSVIVVVALPELVVGLLVGAAFAIAWPVAALFFLNYLV